MKGILLLAAALLPLAASQEIINVGTCSFIDIIAFLGDLPNGAECSSAAIQLLDPIGGIASESQLATAADTFCTPDCGGAFSEYVARFCADINTAIGVVLFCLPTGEPDGLNHCRFVAPDYINATIIGGLSACASFNASDPTCEPTCMDALSRFSSAVGCCYQVLYTTDILQGYVDGEIINQSAFDLVSSINNTVLWSSCGVEMQPYCDFNPFPGTSTLVTGTCTQTDVDGYIKMLPERCQNAYEAAFNPVSTQEEVSAIYDVTCMHECGGALFELERDSCDDLYETSLPEALCSKTDGAFGDRCYAITDPALRNASFFFNTGACFAYDPAVGICPPGCKDALTELVRQVGCCYQTFYNDTVFLDYLILSGQLSLEERTFFSTLGYPAFWNACEVPLVKACEIGFDGAVKFMPSNFVMLLAIFLALKLF